MTNTLFNFGLYKCIVFTGSETWVVDNNWNNVKVLVVAGGGGGGNYDDGNDSPGGGGGAGGLIYNSSYSVTPGANVIVTIGNGGNADTNGNNSVFGTLTAIAGGAGKQHGLNGNAGGSGGGGGEAGGDADYISPRQGYDGGSGGTTKWAGGGGGASQVGTDFNSTTFISGKGGDGLNYSSIFGTSVGVNGVFAGGGGGGNRWDGGGTGTGGTGGGGKGAFGTTVGDNGITNTGGGGGGASNAYKTGKTGGSGVVIIQLIPSAGFFHWFFSEAWRKHDKLWKLDRLILPKDLGFSY